MAHEEPEDAELAGRPARRFVFEGRGKDLEGNEALLRGECYQVMNQGVVYWLLTWTTAEAVEMVGAEFASMRQQFELVDDPARKEVGPELATYSGTKGAYSVRAPSASWKRHDPATDFDPNADLALNGSPPAHARGAKARSAFNKSVDLLVLVLPAGTGGGPLEAARATWKSSKKRTTPKRRSRR